MAAPSIAAVGTFVTGNDASGSTQSFAKPAGVVDGSLLVAVYTMEHSSGASQLSTPSGWQKPPDIDGSFQAVSSGTALYVFYKVVADAGSEPSSYAMPAQSGRWRRGAILRITDHDPADPWDVGDGAVAANSSSVPSTSVTTTGDERLLIWTTASYNLSSWPNLPTGFTEHAAWADGSSTVSTLATRTLTNAGTVTTGTISAGTSTGKAVWLGALKPPSSGPAARLFLPF